jgi:hypothetical protein
MLKIKCKQWASRFKNQDVRHWDVEGYYKKWQSTSRTQYSKAFGSLKN